MVLPPAKHLELKLSRLIKHRILTPFAHSATWRSDAIYIIQAADA
jgi:hypothetical protein